MGYDGVYGWSSIPWWVYGRLKDLRIFNIMRAIRQRVQLRAIALVKPQYTPSAKRQIFNHAWPRRHTA